MATETMDLRVDKVVTPDSKNVKRYGYREADKVLVVEFVGGGQYEYLDVPQDEFERMQNAPSVGKYLAHEITPKYKARKLEIK